MKRFIQPVVSAVATLVVLGSGAAAWWTVLHSQPEQPPFSATVYDEEAGVVMTRMVWPLEWLKIVDPRLWMGLNCADQRNEKIDKISQMQPCVAAYRATLQDGTLTVSQPAEGFTMFASPQGVNNTVLTPTVSKGYGLFAAVVCDGVGCEDPANWRYVQDATTNDGHGYQAGCQYQLVVTTYAFQGSTATPEVPFSWATILPEMEAANRH